MSKIHQIRDYQNFERLGDMTPEDLVYLIENQWRLSPLGYATHFDPLFLPAKHLKMISDAIVDACMNVGPKRIIVAMPPRHGKSVLVSRWTPVWFLDNWPNRRVMFGSYEATYAATWGKAVRETIREYSDELRVKLSSDTTARAHWDTVQGGYMVAQGVGGSLTGRGADLLIIDDPIKNSASAFSQITRDMIWDWWNTTAYTRLEPGGVALVVMTRWHEDDLVGRIMAHANEGGEYWEVLRIPAISESYDDPLGRVPGEVLWPERYDYNAMMSIKQSVPEYTWESMYQQNPTNPAGTIFRRVWTDEHRFDITDRDLEKECVARWISWDTAMKDTDSSAFSAMVVGELMPDYSLNLREVYRDRLDFPNLMEQVSYFAHKYNSDGKLTSIVIEDQASGASLYQTMIMTMPDEYADLLIPFSPSGSKEQRARQASIWVRNGSVRIPQPNDAIPWLFSFEEELFGFPTTTYKDQVDAFVQLIQFIEHLLRAGHRARSGLDGDEPPYASATEWNPVSYDVVRPGARLG